MMKDLIREAWWKYVVVRMYYSKWIPKKFTDWVTDLTVTRKEER